MNILLDMNIPEVWEGFLCDAGHSAIHWSRVGNIRAMDNEIMKWARENNHVVFTHDLDFDSVDRRRLRHALPGFCWQDAGGPRADPLRAVFRHSLRSKLECVAVSIHVSNPAPFRTRIWERGTRSVKKLRARNAVSTIPTSDSFRVPSHAMDDNQATHQTSKATTMSFAQEIYQKSLSLPPEKAREVTREILDHCGYRLLVRLAGSPRPLPRVLPAFLVRRLRGQPGRVTRSHTAILAGLHGSRRGFMMQSQEVMEWHDICFLRVKGDGGRLSPPEFNASIGGAKCLAT